MGGGEAGDEGGHVSGAVLPEVVPRQKGHGLRRWKGGGGGVGRAAAGMTSGAIRTKKIQVLQASCWDWFVWASLCECLRVCVCVSSSVAGSLEMPSRRTLRAVSPESSMRMCRPSRTRLRRW